MINRAHLKSDLKQMRQEPIMTLFVLLSLVLIIVFKLIIEIGAPILLDYTGFDLLLYRAYILSMVYMLQPLMLGTVIGFFMLDEKDARIFELLRVTPLGISGYMVNRLLLPVLLNLFYMSVAYMVIGYSVHSVGYLLPIGLFLSVQTVGIGLFIAMVSEDKVKGLTYAKAVSGLVVFGFVQLIPIPAVQLIGKVVPQYYVTEMLMESSAMSFVVGLFVHVLWILFIYRKAMKRL